LARLASQGKRGEIECSGENVTALIGIADPRFSKIRSRCRRRICEQEEKPAGRPDAAVGQVGYGTRQELADAIQ
jgi:hypothetical protein